MSVVPQLYVVLFGSWLSDSTTSSFFPMSFSSHERYKLSGDGNQMSVVQKSKRVCVSISERKWLERSIVTWIELRTKESLSEN